jgi:hypothetical protein
MEKPKIINVTDLIKKNQLSIPHYQRPYKWSIKNVNQLIDDILTHKDKSSYRIGTLVLHDKDGALSIVDGQQRCITILLVILALSENMPQSIINVMKNNKYEIPSTSLLDKLTFNHPLSQKNIHQNYREIKRRVVDFDFNAVRFFLEKCEFVEVVLKNVSEAFQFFDSQNARGRDLEPHDLLKAYHLRELNQKVTEFDKIKLIEKWEKLRTDDLKFIFSQFLFRIRNWSKGSSARYFSKDDVSIFKGISSVNNEIYPFSDIYSIADLFIEDYNYHSHRNFDKLKIEYPFQLSQVIINGKRFFEYVYHYWNARDTMYNCLLKDEKAKEIIGVLNTYAQRNRIGDQYTRNLFDCALLLYWDKFGVNEIGRVAEKLFIWAYTKRLTQVTVQLATIDNYALEYPQVFSVIQHALKPQDILNIPISPINANEIERTELEDIIQLTKKMNYYEQ